MPDAHERAVLQEGIQAVRERASFLERELREQLADARKFLEEERGQRRAAEASLGRQLAQAQADASALRARLAEDTQQQHEVGIVAWPGWRASTNVDTHRINTFCAASHVLGNSARSFTRKGARSAHLLWRLDYLDRGSPWSHLD